MESESRSFITIEMVAVPSEFVRRSCSTSSVTLTCAAWRDFVIGRSVVDRVIMSMRMERGSRPCLMVGDWFVVLSRRVFVLYCMGDLWCGGGRLGGIVCDFIFFDFWGWWASVGGIVCCIGGFCMKKPHGALLVHRGDLLYGWVFDSGDAVFLGHHFDHVDDSVGVADLVVVPTDDFEEVAVVVELDACGGIEC